MPAPVVLLPCSSSSSRQWRKLEAALDGSYRTLAIDFAGYGGRPFPNRPEQFRLDDEVDIVEQAVAGLSAPLHLVGHSYGGAVAFKFAFRHPRLVRSLCAHEPVLFTLLANCCPAEWNEIRRLSAEVKELSASGHDNLAARCFIDYWSGPGAWAATPPERRRAHIENIPKLLLDFQALYADTDPLSRYASLPFPVLVTYGSSGPSSARRVARLLADVLPPGSVRELESAGHMAPLTHPAMVNSLIADHLAAAGQ